jgi:hypothetical protein
LLRAEAEEHHTKQAEAEAVADIAIRTEPLVELDYQVAADLANHH